MLNKKIELKSLDQVLGDCPCGIGCHICSGTVHAFDNTLKDYYDIWKNSPGNYCVSFMRFIEQGGTYVISDELLEVLK